MKKQISLKDELRDCYQGQGGNVGRVTFKEWLREVADDGKHTMQDAALEFLGETVPTKGPWEPTHMVEVPGQTGSTFPMPDDWIGVICSDEANGDVVAYCHPINADLIAAAPEMHHILELLAEQAYSPRGSTLAAARDILRKVKEEVSP